MTHQAKFRTLADIPRAHAASSPSRTAFEYEGRTISYGQLDRQSGQCANGLLDMGLKRGQRIGYLGKNLPEYWEIVLASAKAGGVTTPINWRLAVPEIAYIIGDAGIQLLFISTEFSDAARQLLADCEQLRHIFVVDGHGGEFSGYAEWRDSYSPSDPFLDGSEDDDALQMYTSGTTGRPKGAILSHRSLMAPRYRDSRSDSPEWSHWSSSDVSLVAMPCFHIGGTGWGLTTLFHGARGVVMREFQADRVLDFIDRHAISKIFMVPAAMKIVVDQPGVHSVDFSQLKYMLYGASPIPLNLLQKCMDTFKCGFVQMYGMTETAGTIVALPPEDHDPNGNERMRSAGKALGDVELAVVDSSGNFLAPGEIGEVVTRSPSNMTGYWNLEKSTREALSEDGWLHTGDAGYLDEDGYLFIHDRVKDMIISGGENVYPAEVENAIASHPAVSDVAVIGIPDEKWGESVKAFVVLEPGKTATANEIISWTRNLIAGFKSPKSVDIVETVPRNASGKILRRELRAPFWPDHQRHVN